jgi:hypothetical protein
MHDLFDNLESTLVVGTNFERMYICSQVRMFFGVFWIWFIAVREEHHCGKCKNGMPEEGCISLSEYILTI